MERDRQDEELIITVGAKRQMVDEDDILDVQMKLGIHTFLIAVLLLTCGVIGYVAFKQSQRIEILETQVRILVSDFIEYD
jgi:hypothetical protein